MAGIKKNQGSPLTLAILYSDKSERKLQKKPSASVCVCVYGIGKRNGGQGYNCLTIIQLHLLPLYYFLLVIYLTTQALFASDPCCLFEISILSLSLSLSGNHHCVIIIIVLPRYAHHYIIVLLNVSF